MPDLSPTSSPILTTSVEEAMLAEIKAADAFAIEFALREAVRCGIGSAAQIEGMRQARERIFGAWVKHPAGGVMVSGTTRSTDALRALSDALDALERARLATTQGFADDHCGNAIREVKKAIHVEAGAITIDD